MSNHRLSIDQKFRLEAAFREIDNCNSIETLREVTKQIITSEENEKAYVREVITHMRKELEVDIFKKYHTGTS